jgi:broad-specificity NMP kinase
MTAAVLITGAPGSGKSSVLDALGTLLEIAGVAHGAIETEQLTRGAPPLGSELLVAQLRDVIELQRGAGRRLFLIAFTAESAEQLRAAQGAIGAERALVVALHAPADVLAARLQAREPDRWPGKAGLIAHARELAPLAAAIEGVEQAIDTAGREPEDVAREVLDAMRAAGLVAPAPGSGA